MDHLKLTSILTQQYGASSIRLHRLAQGEQNEKDVYHVTHENGQDWVLRVYNLPHTASTDASLNDLTSVLLFLDGQSYPAEAIVGSVSGALYSTHDNLRLLVTTHLGQSLHAWRSANASAFNTSALAPASLFNYPPNVLLAFGEALGRLHALPVENAALPSAGMLPEPELAWASQCLSRCADRVPVALETEYEFLIEEVQQFNCCWPLPQCLVHNDCNFGNVVLMPTGKIALVDWEGSGLGPALLDIGFVLSACFDKPRRHLNREALSAFVEGYCRSRTLMKPELDLLADAVRFRTLVLLACCFSDRVCGTLPNEAVIYGATYAAWQAQHQAADKITETAQRAFRQIL